MQDLLLAHFQLGMLALAAGDSDRAEGHADSMIQMPGGGAYDRERASALTLKGMVSQENGDPAKAGDLFGQAEKLAREVQSSSLLLNVLTARMYLSAELKDTETTSGLLAEATELTDQLDLVTGRARLSVLRARDLQLTGDVEGSMEELETAASIFREHDLKPALADVLGLMCMLQQGNSRKKAEELEELEREMGVSAGRRSAVLQVL
jgi:hypothetical protein